MRRATTICRYILGVFFTVFGLNGFLHFIPEPPPPPGLAGQYHAAMSGSQYFHVVYFLQFACGILLLLGRYVPLALTVLGAILANILLFHLTMKQEASVQD